MKIIGNFTINHCRNSFNKTIFGTYKIVITDMINNRAILTKLCAQIGNGEITEEQYLEGLEIENCSYAFFLKSNYYFQKKDYLKAKEAIDKAIEIVTPLLNCEENISDTIVEANILFLNAGKLFFRLAGEIYAYLGELGKSEEYFIKMQYYSIQLNSGFNNIDFGYVYSFRNVNKYSLSDLALNSITVVSPDKMNDPFDSPFRFWSNVDILTESCGGDKPHIKSYSKSFNYYKIRCFVGNKTLSKNNGILKKMLMWSHYADGHKGFCICYKLSSYFIKRNRNDEYTHWFLKPIIYNPASKMKPANSKETNTDQLFAVKSNEWKYENEIRLIYYNPKCTDGYNRIVLDQESTIDAVYFGYGCLDNNIKIIMKLLGKNIKYYKMGYNSKNGYLLSINEISYINSF